MKSRANTVDYVQGSSQFFSAANIFIQFQYRSINLAGPVTHTGLNKYVSKLLLETPQVRRVNGKLMHRVRGNIKNVLRGMGFVRPEFY